MRVTSPDVPQWVVDRLDPLPMSKFYDLAMEGADLYITNAADFDWPEMVSIAKALGVKDMDLVQRDNWDNGIMEKAGGGCSTCGWGAMLRVYNIANLA